uniref:Uncharacterized protein n=1 Tax=Panagrolaimus sp. ES5 TaxID=591445 RepID=A0AC34GW90_9BILA
MLARSFVEFRQQFPDLCETNEPNSYPTTTPTIESAPLQPSNGFGICSVMKNNNNNSWQQQQQQQNNIFKSGLSNHHSEVTGPSTSTSSSSSSNNNLNNNSNPPMTLFLSTPNRLSLPNSFSHPNLSTSASPIIFPTIPCKKGHDDDEPSNGPTQILDFLFLGSQQDALNREVLKRNGITKIINLSEPGIKCESIPNNKNYFLHIPINDSYQAKLLPHFDIAYEFLENAKKNGEKVLVHCLAGISRSATLAIAYIMRTKRFTSDDAYKFVKALRPSISPNFNFMGQLLEYEKQLRERQLLSPTSRPHSYAAASPASPKSDDSPMETSSNDLFLAPPTDQRICKSASANDVILLAPKREGLLNENGKRTIDSPLSFPERPRQLMKTVTNEFFARPGSIPLAPSNTPVKIETSELPSPSTEFGKLDISNFPNFPHLPSLQTPDCPQSAGASMSLSIENPMFDMACSGSTTAPVSTTSKSKLTFNPTAALRAHCKESIIRCLRKNKPSASKKQSSQPKVIDPCSSRCIASSSTAQPPRRFLQRRFFQTFGNLATVTDLPDDEVVAAAAATASADTTGATSSPIKILQRSGSISSQPTGSISPLIRSTPIDSDESTPYKRDPETASIGSASSLEIAVN